MRKRIVEWPTSGQLQVEMPQRNQKNENGANAVYWVEVQGWMASPGSEGTEKDNRLLTDGGSQGNETRERGKNDIQTKAISLAEVHHQ